MRANGVLPQPFLESLAVRVASDASRSLGRLAAAHNLANIFQVCTTWRAISDSELLWQTLDRQIWCVTQRSRATWHDDYVYHHRTALNFKVGHATYATLEGNGGGTCLCVSLSDAYMACGFIDGSVKVFNIGSSHGSCGFRSSNPDRLGPFSLSISGIIVQGTHVIFASLDGNVYVGVIPTRNSRLAIVGNVYNDGPLIDFSGSNRYWIGLFAGVPGRAFHIWSSATQQITFVGGGITDPEAVLGWRSLAEPRDTYRLGRVRVTNEHVAISATRSRTLVLDLQSAGLVLNEQEHEEAIIVDSVSVHQDLCFILQINGLARVMRVRGFEEVYRFQIGNVELAHARVLCGLNSGYLFISIDGSVSVWDAVGGEFLYDLPHGNDDEIADLVADDERVAAVCFSNTRVHLWDFRAQL